MSINDDDQSMYDILSEPIKHLHSLSEQSKNLNTWLDAYSPESLSAAVAEGASRLATTYANQLTRKSLIAINNWSETQSNNAMNLQSNWIKLKNDQKLHKQLLNFFSDDDDRNANEVTEYISSVNLWWESAINDASSVFQTKRDRLVAGIVVASCILVVLVILWKILSL